MRRSLSSLRSGLLTAVVLGSLGFGVTQAFARPAAAALPPSCTDPAYARWCKLNCLNMNMASVCDPVAGCTCIPVGG